MFDNCVIYYEMKIYLKNINAILIFVELIIRIEKRWSSMAKQNQGCCCSLQNKTGECTCVIKQPMTVSCRYMQKRFIKHKPKILMAVEIVCKCWQKDYLFIYLFCRQTCFMTSGWRVEDSDCWLTVWRSEEVQ